MEYLSSLKFLLFPISDIIDFFFPLALPKLDIIIFEKSVQFILWLPSKQNGKYKKIIF